MKSESLSYLYGISPAISAATPSIVGIHRAAKVQTVTCGNFVCWTSEVPRSQFGESLSERIQDLDWLSEMSARHHAIVSSIAEKVDILPARFGTVFLNETSLCKHVKAQSTRLRKDTKRIEGSDEWGIKIFALPHEATVGERPRTGKQYLERKSAGLKARMPHQPDEEVRKFAERLTELSVATADGGKISSGRKDLVFQISLLLQRKNRKKLEFVLRRFNKKWKSSRRVECTGPWPPYSFVSRISHER